MKILIAYDGSEFSDAAIVDLKRAGLPQSSEAVILAVAETSPEHAEVPYGAMVAGPGMFRAAITETEPVGGRLLQDAESLAEQAANRLRADFPSWHVKTEAWIDAAAPAIIRKAHGWRPDLIVVGSHGRTGLRRFVLGSVSHHVVEHAACSVRISRHHLHAQERNIRVLIGVDGSDNSKAAVRAVAGRVWPSGTQVRVVGVFDPRIKLAAATTLEGTLPAAVEEEYRRSLPEAVHGAARDLAKTGLRAEQFSPVGNPAETLLADAEDWGADCIFLGARGITGLDRIMLGSVSSAVAPRAHCSVEIVRSGE